ncbi:hypothetical protein F5Y13DRAFT_196503 [Hypoxylon sp. FL1857]|nr:hypothetical protein F5Y13DRAFT_196503 [Hypoxylon sp. FL1857]
MSSDAQKAAKKMPKTRRQSRQRIRKRSRNYAATNRFTKISGTNSGSRAASLGMRSKATATYSLNHDIKDEISTHDSPALNFTRKDRPGDDDEDGSRKAGLFQDANTTSHNPIRAEQSNTSKPIGFQMGRESIDQGTVIEGGSTYISGGQEEDSYLPPTWERSITDSGSGCLDYYYPFSSTFGRLSSRSSSQTLVDSDSIPTRSPSPCENRLGPDSEHCNALGCSTDHTLDSRCGQASMSLRIDQPPCSMDMIAEDPLYCLETQNRDSLKQQDRQITNPLLKSESYSNRDITGSKGIMESYDYPMVQHGKQSTISRTETHAILPTHYPQELTFGRNPDYEYRQSAENKHPPNKEAGPNRRWFACPWYKRNPWKYQDCAKYKLQRIKDVKQHTYRKHTKPEIYCPVCFAVFTKVSERDGHIQRQSCDSRAEPKLDAISEDQRKQLKQNANRGKSDVEQWYKIWDTIFPSIFHPRSPYLGNGQEEFLPLLRSFWNKRGPKIIYSILQTSTPKIEPRSIQLIMDVIFDQFEEESWSWTSATDGEPSYSNFHDSSCWNLDNTPLGDLAQKQWSPSSVVEGSSWEQFLTSESDRNLEHAIDSDIDVNYDIGFLENDPVLDIVRYDDELASFNCP